jgi:hypothetical protein
MPSTKRDRTSEGRANFWFREVLRVADTRALAAFECIKG